jgi:fumarate reductase (CoM/CoB) subunit B
MVNIRRWFAELEQDHACPIHHVVGDNRYTPFNTLSQYLKLKFKGVESLKDDTDPIFLCTTCNKCHMAGLRYKLRENLVRNGIIPHNLPYLKKAISKYGNPYSNPRDRQAFLDKSYETSSDTALFLGCTSSLVPRIQRMATSAINLLGDSGVDFKLLSDESCCGYILYTMGDVEAAKEIAQKNMQMFKKEGVKRLITLCPGCYLAFNTFYPPRGVEVRHLLEVIEPKDLPQDLTLTIHYPDHMGKLKKNTQKLLKDCKVYRASYPCCGVNLISYNPELSMKIARQMVSESTGPLVTYCPSCYLILTRVDRDKIKDLYSLLDTH